MPIGLRLYTGGDTDSYRPASVFHNRVMRPSTVREVIDLYLQLGERKKGSEAGTRERRRVWGLFTDAYGDGLLAECDGLTLLAWIDSMPGWAADNTKGRIIRTIKRPFNWCLKLGRIDRNPFAGVSPPRGDEGRDMTPEEFQIALRAASPLFRRVLLAFVLSGMRPFELRTLEWSHLRPDLGAIIQKEHKTAHVTKQARRIPLPACLLKLLLWIRRHQPEGEIVFLNSHCRQWSRRALDKYFHELRQRAGLPDDCKLYSCRHHYGTHALLNGNDLATVAELMGHRSIKTTMRYVHLASQVEHLKAAAERAVRKR